MQKLQHIGTQARDVSQAMTERVDKVEGQMMLMPSLVKTEAYQAADYKSAELEKKILREVDQKVMALETRLIQRMNEDRQITAIRLQEIKDVVTTVQDGQQKMCEAIEQMRKDLQELIQKDVGTDEEGDEDPVLVGGLRAGRNRVQHAKPAWMVL